MRRIPATIITGFLGAGKTTLLRHVLEHAGGRRIAIIVNEFGTLGIDGDTLRSCGIVGCSDDDIIELANGCICCTVADEFLPTMENLLDRPHPPEHIVIETSGLALPKPLLRAFNWPTIRTRMTVDGVVTVVDAPAVAAGRFADDPEAVALARAADPSLDHDNPLSEVYEDQLLCADLVVLNKTDLLDDATCVRLEAAIAAAIPRAVKILRVSEGRVPPGILLGLDAASQDDLDVRPSHHDLDADHEHDDFESFVVRIGEVDAPERLVASLARAAAAHDILRMKGFAAVRGRAMRLAVQGVGTRFRHQFDRPWSEAEPRRGDIVVIGRQGLDRDAIESLIVAGLAAD
jgi:cobalamin biosynthesis protein CobW